MDEALTSIGTAEITVYRHYYGGGYQEPIQNRYIDAVNPATGKVDGMMAFGCAEDIDHAVKYAAAAGHDGWCKLTSADRHDLLLRMAELMTENKGRLADYDAADTGKTLSCCRQEWDEAVRSWKFYSGIADHVVTGGKVNPTGTCSNYRVPLGVVGILLPAISPTLDFSRYVASALACGNTVVVKPSEYSPRSALALADLAKSAGFPDGVINVVCGNGESTGNCLVRHPAVAHICFAGNSEVGKLVASNTARNLAGISCELSAKNSVIVFADADLKKAAAEIMLLAFLGNGQSNFCAQRILVHSSVKPQLSEMIVDGVKKLKVGYPKKPSTDIGPLLSEENRDRVDCFIRMAINDGARILAGGEKVGGDRLGDGFYFEATVLDKVKPDMQIAIEEIRGPVITFIEFNDDDEVLKICNACRYGMAAWIFTETLSRASYFARELNAGSVLINHGPVSRAALPISPYGDSGLGSNLGLDAVANLTRVKNICFEGC